MRKIKLNQLEMLVTLVETGSFSATALELDCAQSRVSYVIGELEQAVGARLLNRSRAGCTPTDAGQRVLVQARAMLRIADNIVQTVSDEEQISGEVSISCFRSIGTHLLPYALEVLRREYPNITVHINDSCVSSPDVNLSVENGHVDIGITCRTRNERLLAKPFFMHDAYVLVVPIALKLQAPVSWTALGSLPFIQPYNPGGAWLMEQYRAQGLPMTTSGKLHSDTGILAMVSRGMGFSIFPALAAFPVPDGVHIVELRDSVEHGYMLVAQPERAREKAVSIVMRILADKRILRQTNAFRAGIIALD